MRKIFNLIVWISGLSILLLSCSKDETENDKKPNADDNNMVTVSLGLTGDILEVEESPLSKARERADIYGVQIYSSPKDEDNYEPYGGGRFIDKSKIQVKLFKDRKYKFEVTVFPNGEYEVDENGEKRAHTGIKIPMGADGMDIADSIKYRDCSIGDLSGSIVDFSGNTRHHPTIDRYYGKLIDYIPIENSTVNIDLKRVVAGLTFKITNTSKENYVTFFTSLKVEVGDETILDITSHEMIFTANTLIALQGENGYYTDKWFENPIDELTLKITLISETSSETGQTNQSESFTQTVTLKRKMNYTFQINIPETFLVSNGINVTEEDKTWDDNVTVDNIYFGNLTIENEEDLRAFKEANYTKVTGDLIFRYWDNNIMSPFQPLKSIGGDLKFTASDKCLFNDMDMFPYNNGTEVNGSIEVVATVPRCFCNLRYFKGVLGKIGGNFKIVGTEWSFTALECIYFYLDEIGGNLEITTSDNNSFNVFRGTEFCSLESIGGDIILKNLPALKDYCDLKTVLQNHTGQFIVSGNAYNPTKEQILAGECSKQSE